MTVVTRFAPSPTNHLHLGHVYSALFAWRLAARGRGAFLIRIEDIDDMRRRPEFVASILDDLEWLGLRSARPVMRQSRRMGAYAAALARLRALGVVYECFCSRKDIRREIAESGAAPHRAPDGAPVYPGLCRDLDQAEAARRVASGQPHALRLNTAAALALTGPLSWRDGDAGPQAARPELMGDVVLARRDLPTSYHLAATVDDAAQGVSLVTRGDDLRHATHVHTLLQALLGLAAPDYRFHRLLTDAAGRRIAKRDNPLTIRQMRAAGATPADLIARAGLDPAEFSALSSQAESSPA